MHRTHGIRPRTRAGLTLLALLCGLSSALGHDSVYKVVDEHGNITYTDAPPAGATQSEPVELPAINRRPATEAHPTSRADSPRQARQATHAQAAYQHAAIRSPEHESTLPAGASHLAVIVDLEPALQEGHWVQILIDGAPAGPPAESVRQSIHELERGMHFLSARVLDGTGNVVAETEAVTVHVRRPVVGGPTSGQSRPPGAALPRSAPK